MLNIISILRSTVSSFFQPDNSSRSSIFQFLASTIIVLASALACFPFTAVIGYRTVSLIFLFVLSLLPLRFRLGPVLLSATMAALAWNFFFIPPLFTFAVKHAEDILMLCLFFIVAAVSGTLSTQLRERELNIRQRESHASALFALTKDLSSAHSQNEVIKAAVANIMKFFHTDVAIFLGDADGDIHSVPHSASSWKIGDKESSIAAWTYWNERKAGQHTDMHSSSEAVYFALSGPRYPLGVIGIKLPTEEKLTREQESLLENFIAQITSAVEREMLNEVNKKSVVVAESERLYRILFNSISHELRTPIATIMGASENLLMLQKYVEPPARELYSEIHMASERLNRLVANLLDMSRLESGMLQPKLNWCDVRDIINASIKELEREILHHPITVNVRDDVPLLKLDFGLIEQALINLIYNAIVHTPDGTSIEIHSRIENGQCVITVSDNGPGIPKSDMKKIFDKFYRAKGTTTGGTGLGLPIVKGFIEAHRGTLSVRNRMPTGAEFRIEILIHNEPT